MKSKLSITIGLNEDDSENLSVNISGSPNLVLGFIARARHELDKNEKIIMANIDKPKKE